MTCILWAFEPVLEEETCPTGKLSSLGGVGLKPNVLRKCYEDLTCVKNIRNRNLTVKYEMSVLCMFVNVNA